jgi:hypothetical protein
MSNDYLMNIATVLYLLCYAPDFYANYVNKNANMYNVLEKVVLLSGTCFSLSYSISINNQALLVNYIPLFCLDSVALIIRIYYAYRNRNIDVRVLTIQETGIQRNPLHSLENVLEDSI